MRLTKGKKRSADRAEKKASGKGSKGAATPAPTAASLGVPGMIFFKRF